ncbi:TPA: phenylacetic acid degradation protein PaaD, partial [Corynebacterium striatum]|nr:phenylacetic acid degradation protein PaaD [Corynebacterium striatum]
RQSWGRNGIVDVELTVEGKPIAEFRGTFRVIPARK